MRNDKKSHMAKANKLFQERFNANSPNVQEEAFEYTDVPDINPRLTNLIQKGL